MGELPEVQFPLGSLREGATHLRRPFTAAAIRWKVQTTWDGGAMIVAHIDARLVVERLNLVVPHLWFDDYEVLRDRLILCRLTVDGVTRQDVGEGVGKALWSDGLKRAAVKFGVGVSVYALPQIRLRLGPKDSDLRTREVKGRPTPIIDDRTERKLREGYEKWLREHGEPKFGAPLDHGDVEGAQGDVDASEAEVDTAPEERLPRLTDDRSEALRTDLRKAYDVLKERRGVQFMLPGEFNRRVQKAEHSHEALESLLCELRSEAEEVPS